MRKAQKQQVKDGIELLKKAQKEIKRQIEKGKVSIVQELLIQCQECSVALNTMIANIEGEDCSTIDLLNQYGEWIYQCYQEVCVEQRKGSSKIKELQKLLSNIETSVEQEIKIRKEVVFLPYKASMWDSLESVWKAAEEDEECDAYVVPIPYFDKNPDGSFKEFHYEGDQYPSYVPITKYQDYDFETRKPDMIFIHNPYDECNYVTSVYPFFYSKQLKEFTEKLVYIPYFVLGDINPENENEVEGMAHFCTLPGVINADKVIVQSEAMRQAYIKVLTNYVEGSTKSYWEQRILGLGSPKFDKVQNTKLEDLVIPEDWKKIIEKEDGSWKKIIFYNTSVTALLEHDEKMLTKMKDVFRIFYENREEVALLWRPHPLIKATIESMRPHLWKQYEKLVEEYKKAGWGIYDDTAELDRVIE